MTEPEIDEEKFQEWLQAHAHIVMAGTHHIDAVRLLYRDAFFHGWRAASEIAEKSHNSDR
jgi:hypothetical protein